MAEKPPHVLLVDCPPSRHDGGGRNRQQRREWRNNPACARACAVAVLVLIGAAVITGATFLAIFLDRQFPSKDPVYTVAITGVAGLDQLLNPPVPWDDGGLSSSPSPSPPADYDVDDYSSLLPLSPVFDLTFRIDNTRNAYYKACVPGLSRAEVSYGDALLAGVSVPPFCAGRKRTSGGGVAARAWAEDVAVPRFLWDQLAAELDAGDASVDVKVNLPKSFCWNSLCGAAMLSCKAKIRGGTSPACRLDFL